MNTIIEAVKLITGIELRETQDPNFNHYQRDDDIHFSISELTADFTVESGIQRFSKDNPTHAAKGDYQIYRVVEYPGQGVLKYRLCKAIDGSEYAAYIVADLCLTTPENHDDVLSSKLKVAQILTRDRS